MPRRPLFCPTCSELLDQLAKAAEAAATARPCASAGVGSDQLQAALEAWNRLRIQHLQIWEKARRHLESEHGRFSISN